MTRIASTSASPDGAVSGSAILDHGDVREAGHPVKRRQKASGNTELDSRKLNLGILHIHGRGRGRTNGGPCAYGERRCIELKRRMTSTWKSGSTSQCSHSPRLFRRLPRVPYPESTVAQAAFNSPRGHRWTRMLAPRAFYGDGGGASGSLGNRRSCHMRQR
ncbi:hypothetical protein FA95DRAFT_823752 [Auriscalpium vulgare]|uniref:Uncharacterized protein n=1 Tax=Auriscalpium vulgare TaxID=40419 RepID=A0ACB8RB49_9AGAM|nr:hypothetical protein FA95DRAFT_823752 [Auriscalpium vulgare]